MYGPSFRMFVSFSAPLSLILYNCKCIIGCKSETKGSKDDETQQNETKILTVLCAAAVLTVFWLACSEKAEQWLWKRSGIPDVVSSTCDGSECRLTVVANSGCIEDREGFAREVALNTGKFVSVGTIFEGTGGQPSIVDIAVYLKKKDIGKTDPVMRICLEFSETERTYESREDAAGECRIYIDDNRIGNDRGED